MKITVFLIALLNLIPSHSGPLRPTTFLQKPKLIVVLVIDQFRADYLPRLNNQFLPAQSKNQLGGFNYLMTRGAYFPFANFNILQSMTCPGHAMILSGANPAQMKIPLNEWFDRRTGKMSYCVQDSDSPVVGSTGSAGSMGLSPRLMNGSNLVDEIKNASLPSKAIAIALKDRSAILMGGAQGDLALWFDYDKYKWVTSRFYVKEGDLPKWTQNLNDKIQQTLGQKFSWKLGTEEIGKKSTLFTPYGNKVTIEAALQALQEYNLGKNGGTDLLAISFSSHDHLGHKFGPNTPEMTEMTLDMDRTISRLLTALQKNFSNGLKDVTIVLTADHGVAPAVGFLQNKSLASGQIKVTELLEKLNAKLNEELGKPSSGTWISNYKSFNFYLNQEAIKSKKLTAAAVENSVRQFLEAQAGVETAVTRTDVKTRSLPVGLLGEQVLNTYVEALSGDVILIPKPFFYDDKDAATHMTGYSYDSAVPLVFLGERFKAGVYSEPAKIIDIAPTLSFITGVLPPAMSQGRVLSEALKD